jgi:hypothetical protein
MDLSNNDFIGELPIQLFSQMKHLGKFWFVTCAFCAWVLPYITHSISVELSLESNQLTGSIPPELENLHRLEALRLGKNNLHGELPNDFQRLHYLGEFNFRSVLCGTIHTLQLKVFLGAFRKTGSSRQPFFGRATAFPWASYKARTAQHRTQFLGWIRST